MKIYCNVYMDERYIVDAQSIKMKRELINGKDFSRKRNNYKYYIIAKDILGDEYNIYVENTKSDREESNMLKVIGSINEEFFNNRSIINLKTLIEKVKDEL